MNTFAKLPEEKRWLILDAAAEAFADKGYYGTSIKELCEKANISNGALYKYFLNKEELFLSVLNISQSILVENLYEKHTKTDKSIKITIREYLEEIVTISSEYPDYLTIYTSLSSPSMEKFSEKLTDSFMESGSYIYYMVIAAKERGEVKTDIDERALSFLIDNQFILFLYSMLSDYHDKRFRALMRIESSFTLTNEKKMDFILDSLDIFFT